MQNIVDVYKRTGKVPEDTNLNVRYETLASVKEQPNNKEN